MSNRIMVTHFRAIKNEKAKNVATQIMKLTDGKVMLSAYVDCQEVEAYI